MNKVLIVGGAGYIGGITADRLIKAGHEVTVFDNLTYEDRFLKDVDFVYGDIRDTPSLIRASSKADHIILMAALVGDPACQVNPDKTMEINRDAVRNFSQYLGKYQHLTFFSTCSVYGAQDNLLTEESNTNPLSVYAESKLQAEEYIIRKGGTIFRLGTVFGLGDTYSRIRLDLVVNVLAMRAIFNGKIKVFGGKQWRPIIAAKDIAGFTTENVWDPQEGTFILSKENVQIIELAKRVLSVLPKTRLEIEDIADIDARNYKVDNTKATKAFKFQPETEVETEVMNMVQLFLAGRIKNPELNCYHNGLYIKDYNVETNLEW